LSLRSIWVGLYQGFERLVGVVLTGLIGLVILVALYRLAVSVVMGLVRGALDPTDPQVFQSVFGEVLTLMIALEFNHTLQLAGARHESIVQTQVVVLIALLALARKFIIMDFASETPAQVIALAAMAVALGLVYRLTRDRPVSGRRSEGRAGAERRVDGDAVLDRDDARR
jgi:uncharacterized membrane protein (DUF373 family)